jgi:hypothetical protein
VAHHGVKRGVGRTVFETLLDQGLELGFFQLVDIEHGDVGHG